jgi:prepilin-type N-terminal cleavage/methylation domain-containing protein
VNLRRSRGFTLVELLVVIAIVVLLMAMLAPALERAIYHAALVQCAAQQKLVASGCIHYAFDYRKAYPWRSACHDPEAAYQSRHLKNNETANGQTGVPTGWTGRPGVLSAGHDDRPELAPYMDLQVFIDPLTTKISMTGEEVDTISWLQVPYNLIAGFWYANIRTGMTRMGSRMEINNTTFTVLISDMELLGTNSEESQMSHPDPEGRYRLNVADNQNITPGYWSITTAAWWGPWRQRGPIDANAGFDDANNGGFWIPPN